MTHFTVGDIVTTDYNHSLTSTHTITAIKESNTESGLVCQVKPAVPRSGGAGAWLDVGWFTLVYRQ